MAWCLGVVLKVHNSIIVFEGGALTIVSTSSELDQIFSRDFWAFAANRAVVDTVVNSELDVDEEQLGWSQLMRDGMRPVDKGLVDMEPLDT